MRLIGSASICALMACLGVAAAPALAQDDLATIRRQIEAERTQFRRAMNAYEARIRALEKKTQELERRQQESASPPAGPAAAAPGTTEARRSGPHQDVDFNIGLVVTGALSSASKRNAVTGTLMSGHHDPIGTGFTLQGAELFFSGVVDPYFDGAASISLKLDSSGETELELEEAWIRTRNLPFGLQVRAGQFFTEFGRINAQHAHEWAFVNQNFLISRMFGDDGMRGVGAQVAWLTPLPWFSQVIIAVQNSRGGAMRPFLGEAGDAFGPATQEDREFRNLLDLVRTVRWVNGFDVTREIGTNIGLSFANGRNATGRRTYTNIFGADIYAKWLPERNTRGFPFVSAQAEFMYRWFDAAFADPGTGNRMKQVLRDYGFYAQLLYGFVPDWVAGFRAEYASSNGESSADPLRSLRWRFSPNLTWYPTERSKLRIQYDYDWAQHIARRSVHTVMVQWEFALGAHGAHKF